MFEHVDWLYIMLWKKHRTRHMFGSIRSAAQSRMCWYDLVQDSIGTLAAARRAVIHQSPIRFANVSRSELAPGNFGIITRCLVDFLILTSLSGILKDKRHS